MERQSYGFGGRGRGRPRGTGRIFFLVRCFSRVLNVCLVAGDRGGRGGGYSWYYRAFSTVEELAIEMNAILNPETSVHLFGALGEVTS